jgi:hypothetical protein
MESAQEQARPERACIRLGPPVEQALAVDETTASADFGEVAETRQLRHDPTDGAVCHSSGSGDLSVRACHELGSHEQGEEDLEAGRLKGADTLEGRLLTGGSLALDEHQERRLIQERVACRVDELDSLGPQGLGERRRHMIRYEEGLTWTGAKLVDNGPKRRRAQTALDLGDVLELTTADLETDRGLSATVGTARFQPENLEPQTEPLHRLDRIGQETPLGVNRSVHQM